MRETAAAVVCRPARNSFWAMSTRLAMVGSAGRVGAAGKPEDAFVRRRQVYHHHRSSPQAGAVPSGKLHIRAGPSERTARLWIVRHGQPRTLWRIRKYQTSSAALYAAVALHN